MGCRVVADLYIRTYILSTRIILLASGSNTPAGRGLHSHHEQQGQVGMSSKMSGRRVCAASRKEAGA